MARKGLRSSLQLPVVAEREDAGEEVHVAFSWDGRLSGEVRRNEGAGVQAGRGGLRLHVRVEGD